MNEINPASRPLTVYELYPTVQTSDVRELYSSDNEQTQDAEDTAKAKQSDAATESDSTENPEKKRADNSTQVVAYQVDNGEIKTDTSFTSSNSTQSWIA